MKKTVEEAQAALAAAESNYMYELQRDSERGEGSGAQERRREENQQSLRSDIAQCKSDLEEAKLYRIQELVDVLLAEFVDMNIGPGGNVPTKTIYLRVCSNGLMWSDVHPALVWAVDVGGLFTFTPGGIADLGSLTLTDAGYKRSRS